MMEIKMVIVGTETIVAKLKGKGDEIENNLLNAITESCILVEGDCKKSMRGTGTPHIPSPPGEPPAVMTGKLRASINYDVKKGKDIEGRVGIEGGTEPDTKNYGLFLEFGTSRMQKRPYLRPALNQNLQTISNKIKEAVKEVAK